MRRFYLMRHKDINGNSGIGVVAEGIVFDDGTGAFTWLTKIKTVTIFMKVSDVVALHSHNGRTEIAIEGSKKFSKCQEIAKEMKVKARLERKSKRRKDQYESNQKRILLESNH